VNEIRRAVHDTVLIPSAVLQLFLAHNSFMFRLRFAILLTSLFLLFHSSDSFAASRLASKKATYLTTDYASALAAADHFLQAWQSADPENGIALLTSRIKQATSTDAIEKFFSNSAPSAFEISRGKLLKHGRYEFPVVLLDSSKPNHSRRRSSTIIVLHSSGDDWAIDKLP
jgi:hypothetical protein